MKFDFRKFPRLSLVVWRFTSPLGPSLGARKGTGNIVGTVRDASGATSAKLALRDLEPGLSFTTSDNDAGVYLAGPLRIGHDSFRVEREGCKTAVAGALIRAQVLLSVRQPTGVVCFGASSWRRRAPLR
jgi:hypothetical protein